MAKLPAPQAKNPNADIEKQANDRLAECRRYKDGWALDFKECYFFAAPHRQRQVSSVTAPSKERTQDAGELQTSLGFELAQDFITEVVNTFMPEAQQWCERGKGMLLNDQQWQQIESKVREGDRTIFNAMKASNLYPEVAKAFYPDLAIGTAALWIDRRRPSEPITVSAVPLREIECNLGPDGEIDDRFAVRYTRNSFVRSLLPEDAQIPSELAKTIEAKPAERTEVRWGFWRLWDEPGENWQHVILVKNRVVHQARLVGEGSCPLLPMRFNPTADWPWGLGPLIQGLPDLRQIDELEAQKIENVELHLTPPITYPDDSFAAVEQGFEPRMAYPIRVGSEGAVKPIYSPPPPDAAIYQHEEMVHRLRRLFFIDFPEQSGDTPPTLGQWLDEMARHQRRIGTPGLPFWREGPAKIFLRYKYLLEAAGTIEPIKVDGRAVSLQPYNPAQRAAEQQEIATNVQALQIVAQTFPEEFKMWVDGKATMDTLLSKMRAHLIKFRSKDEVKKFIDQVQPMLQGKVPGGTPSTGAPAQPL
ncbi:MAG: hypothetical protein IT562_10830 [Alphaproteobacteria bacterium]|nr:hypothetical protein [Alphaproteobacteria bacterium]